MKLWRRKARAIQAPVPSRDPSWIQTRTIDPNVSEKVLQGLKTDLDVDNVQALESLYSSLERGSFRLLDLGLDPERSAIPLCRLRTTENAQLATDKFRYIAISYTWVNEGYSWYGRKLPSETQLRIDGRVFRLPSRVALVLAMVFQIGIRTVWIDAICINQANHLEKGHQVAHMDGIFTSASEVVLFLGKPTTNTDSLLRSIEDSVSSGFQPDISIDPLVLAGMKEIIRHEYWHRAWILQEISHPTKRRRLFCGTRILTPQATDTVISLLSATLLDFGDQCLASIRDIALEYNSDLLQLLGKTREAKCANLRDAIYSKINLILGEDLLTEPDYSESPARLFIRFARAHIMRYKTLNVLRYVQHHHNPGLPSWVPDWTPDRDVSVRNFESFAYPRKLLDALNVSNDRFTASFSEDSLSLQVQGRILTQMPTAAEFRASASASSKFQRNTDADIEKFCKGLVDGWFMCYLRGCGRPVLLARKRYYYTFSNQSRSSPLDQFWITLALERVKKNVKQLRAEPLQWIKIR